MKNPPKTDESPANKKVSRSFAIGIGVTEWLYLLGLTILSIGVSVLFGWPWALIICGAILLVTAFYNDTH